MSASTSRNAYEDCYDIMDRALETPRGLRCEASDYGDACQLKVRLNYARVLDRKLNTDVYGEDSPKAGISNYDALNIREPKEIHGQWWVLLEPRKVGNRRLEEL